MKKNEKVASILLIIFMIILWIWFIWSEVSLLEKKGIEESNISSGM